MGKAPPICYESHSLSEAVGGRQIAGPAGYNDRDSLDDYDDVRDLLPGFVRFECWNCEHEWVNRYDHYTDGLARGRCPECGWTPGEDYDEFLKGGEVR